MRYPFQTVKHLQEKKPPMKKHSIELTKEQWAE